MITTRILWRALPPWAKLAGAAVVVLVLAFLAGRYDAQRDQAGDAAKARVETITEAERIEDATESLGGDDLLDQLRKRLLPDN